MINLAFTGSTIVSSALDFSGDLGLLRQSAGASEGCIEFDAFLR